MPMEVRFHARIRPSDLEVMTQSGDLLVKGPVDIDQLLHVLVRLRELVACLFAFMPKQHDLVRDHLLEAGHSLFEPFVIDEHLSHPHSKYCMSIQYHQASGLPSSAGCVVLTPARALVPPPRLRAKRVGNSAPLQPGPSCPVSGLVRVIGGVGVLRIPAARVISAANSWMFQGTSGISELEFQK